MRKWIVLFCCAALLMLTACGGRSNAPSSKPDSAAPSSSSGSAGSASQSAASSSGSGMAGPAPGSQSTAGADTAQSLSFSSALDTMIGYGNDTSGADLRHVSAAAGMMDWFNDDTRDPLADPADELAAWYDTLDDNGRQQFYDNWPQIRDQARAIADDPKGSRELLQSIGNTSDYSRMKAGWDDFIEMMDRFWNENQPAAAARR